MKETMLKGQLWRVEGEGTDPSGGGCVAFYVLTNGADQLPDVDTAYSMTRGRNPRECSMYRIDEVRAVSGRDKHRDAGFCGLLLEDVHDQRDRHWVIPLADLFG